MLKRTLALLLVLGAALAASGPVLAHQFGPRTHFGFVFGGPVYYPAPYYYPPAYYHAPAVVVPRVPQTYIEKGDATPNDYWYYCAEAKAYYPYVKQCPGGWQRVTPRQPPG
jgi:hypothetical protein